MLHRTSARLRIPCNSAVGILGCLAVLASAFCFYFSTVAIRWSQAVVDIDASYFAFFRFLLGFVVVCLAMLVARRGPQVKRYDLLIGRTVGNCIAVYCFYQAVRFTSVAEANILNMTYPAFITLISWTLLRDQRDLPGLGMAAAALAGVYLILNPSHLGLSLKSLWGLGSGIAAAGSIVYLNLSRRHHDANTVLFYMFGLGTLVMYLAFRERIAWPDATRLYYLVLCGGSGIIGQFLLTLGFRYVTAVEGGVLSSSRILIAALLGPWIAADAPLGLEGWAGALLIFAANVVLVLRKGR